MNTIARSYGNWLARRRVEGSEIVVAEYGSEDAQSDHSHDYSTLSFIVCGEVVEEAQRRVRRVGPGAVLVKPKGLVHRDAYESGRARLLSVRWSSESDPLVSMRSNRHEVRRHPRLTAAFFGLERALSAGLSSRSVRRRLDAVTSAFARVSAPSMGPSWCDCVAVAIEANPFLDSASLAASRAMHPIYLARAFRARFGVSPSAFARRLRLERAAAAIAAGLPIAAAASDNGFADQSHLTRCFAAEFGLTPSAYRATNDR